MEFDDYPEGWVAKPTRKSPPPLPPQQYRYPLENQWDQTRPQRPQRPTRRARGRGRYGPSNDYGRQQMRSSNYYPQRGSNRGRGRGRGGWRGRGRSVSNYFNQHKQAPFMKLLEEWKLSEYINILNEQGWNDPQDWTHLTDDYLQTELGFRPGDIPKWKRLVESQKNQVNFDTHQNKQRGRGRNYFRGSINRNNNSGYYNNTQYQSQQVSSKWTCSFCIFDNFSTRRICYKCKTPKPNGNYNNGNTYNTYGTQHNQQYQLHRYDQNQINQQNIQSDSSRRISYSDRRGFRDVRGGFRGVQERGVEAHVQVEECVSETNIKMKTDYKQLNNEMKEFEKEIDGWDEKKLATSNILVRAFSAANPDEIRAQIHMSVQNCLGLKNSEKKKRVNGFAFNKFANDLTDYIAGQDIYAQPKPISNPVHKRIDTGTDGEKLWLLLSTGRIELKWENGMYTHSINVKICVYWKHDKDFLDWLNKQKNMENEGAVVTASLDNNKNKRTKIKKRTQYIVMENNNSDDSVDSDSDW
eukprot:320982_1